MDFKKKLQEFNKRWDIIESSSYEEEFKKFKTRIFNILLDIDAHVADEGIAQFCQILGIPERWQRHAYDRKSSNNIITALCEENREKEFYRILQIISLLPVQTASDYSGEDIYSRAILFQKIGEAIELSNINLSITASGKEIIFYPRGEQKLDDVLVDEVLSFLSPESQRHFVDALNLYLNFSAKNAIKSAESLRRSLEEFLRNKLKNQQGLDKNIQEIGKKLKGDGRDAVVRNIIVQTFSLLDQYFNENSKHKDGNIDEAENEFLIYQTGLLMRYINKVI